MRLTPCLLCGALLLLTSSLSFAAGPEPVLLWPNGVPGAIGDEDRDKPEIRVYLPPKEKANGAALVIYPGGGYAVLATDHEGHQVAKWANSIGLTAFVVKYRLAPRYRHPAPLQDAQQAVRFVRANAEKFGVAPNRVGVLGFSAGGHLASTIATHFDGGDKSSDDMVARQSCRPDFAVLCYPVVTFVEKFSHAGSGKSLFGDKPTQEQLESLSNDRHVTAETPPTFLFHTGEDAGVPVENSLAFYAACRRAKVPAELHVYQDGPHGVGLGIADPAVFGWKDRLAAWLQSNGFLANVKRVAAKGTVKRNGQPLRWGMIAFVPSGETAPRAWAMVNQGNYSVPASRGVVVGDNKVLIYNLGSVEPKPTIEDAVVIDKGLMVRAIEAQNEFVFELKD